MDDDFDFELAPMREAWQESESQFDLPPHQRDGWAESQREQADIRRKERRENGS